MNNWKFMYQGLPSEDGYYYVRLKSGDIVFAEYKHEEWAWYGDCIKPLVKESDIVEWKKVV